MPKRRIGSMPVLIDDFVNVRDWGAKGDNSTDDTTAFNTAISKLPSTGGIIYVPEGLAGADDYNVTGGSLVTGGRSLFWILNATVNGSWTASGSGLPGTVINDSSGVVSFTDLDDVPAYSGNSLKFLRLNAGETALEFATGASGISNVVEDITPQLGGALDVNGNIINAAVNTDIEFQTTGTGNIVLNSGNRVLITQDLKHYNQNCGIDFSDGGLEQLDFFTNNVVRMNLNDSGLLLGEANARVTTILDEDNMASDSATALATQQSIKAYVDAQTAAGVTTEANETVVSSPVSSIDVTGLGSYKRLEIQFIDVSGSGTGAIQLRVSTNGGSTFLDASYQSKATSAGGTDRATNAMLVTRSLAAAEQWSGSVIVTFWDDDVASYQGEGSSNTSGTGDNGCGGRGPTGGGFDALRIMMSSGNIDGGTVRVRGVT